MDDLISQILAASVPLRESVNPSDFLSLVKGVQTKIVELFRYTNLNLVPPFLSSILKSIDEYVKMTDKRRKFAAAISLTAIIQLFPFDDFVAQFQPIIDRLLKPGYKPLLKIGTLVLGQLSKIRGHNRDLYLRELVEQSRKQLMQTENVDARYASALIWEELSMTAPEHLFSLEDAFAITITESLTHEDLEISDILIHTCENLFDSKSAPLGATLMTQMPEYLLKVIKERFSNSKTNDQILTNLKLLQFLLEIKPYLPKQVIESELQPQCLQLLKHQNTTIVEAAVLALTTMKTINEIEVDPKVVEGIITMLFTWAKKDPMKTISTFSEVIKAFPDNLLGSIQKFIKRLADFMGAVNPSVGPSFCFKVSISLISALPPDINIEPILDNILYILNKSIVPLPIHKVIIALNKGHPQWGQEFSLFKYTILQIIRQELTITSIRTDRIMYSLLALNEIDNISFSDALEFNSLINKLKKSKDTEVREIIAKSAIKLFYDFPEDIPLTTIRKLVKFALEDPSRNVRMRTLKSFKAPTYRYLSQPDIFPLFSQFLYDEDIEIRKEAFFLVRNLPVFEKSVIRNFLLSSIKQTSTKFNVVTSEIEPAWHVFPNLIGAAGPMLPVYAEAIFGRFISILNQRFKSNDVKERSLMYMNSAILLTIDESLIKSVTKLRIMCPKLIPVSPIIDIFSTILTLPVHPWTLEQSLKSLKNLIASGVVVNENKELMTVLFDLIRTNQSIKIVTKAMKVIGAIGSPELPIQPKKHSLVIKNGMAQRGKFMKYFISKYFNYLVDLFIHVNLENTRESIAKCISCLFLYAPNEIPQFTSFIGIFIDFVSKTSSTRLTVFYHYLTVMIESSGHLISPYVDKIFQAIEDNWHQNFTREGCIVLSSLVIATDGRCDSILQLVVSVSFLLAVSKKNAEEIVADIFNLLRVIAQYNSNFLMPIVTGVLEILYNASNPSYLQEQALDTIEFIVRFCASASHVPPIRRCLIAVTQRSQQRWHDRANQLLEMISGIDFSMPTEKFNFGKSTPIPKFPPFVAQPFIDKMALPKMKDNSLNVPGVSQWFIDLRFYFITEAPNVIIRSMQFLPSYPNFAFMFAYLSVYLAASEEEKIKLSNCLSNIFSCTQLPDVVLTQFLELVEFSLLCEIDFRLDIKELIRRCEENHFYAEALFFLESSLCFKDEPEITPTMIEQLILLNESSNRHIEAKGIAHLNKSLVKHKVWMALGEWESAIELINKKDTTDASFYDKVISYTETDNWSAIHDMKKDFLKLPTLDQSSLAKYFWTAELYTGTKEEALRISNKTGAYTVSDCIQKCILYIICGKLDDAQDIIHISWRYLAASVSATEKNNKTLFREYLFQALQLHELCDVIDILTDDEKAEDFKTTWKEHIRYIKDYPRYQVALYKIRSLAPGVIDMEDLAFHIFNCNMKAGHNTEVNRLVDIFFPNKESQHAKYAYALMHKIEDVNIYENILKDSPDNLKPRIYNTIGKMKYAKSKTIDELKIALDDLQQAKVSYRALSEVLMLIAYGSNDVEFAIKAAETVGVALTSSKKSRNLLHINQMLALLVGFSDSQKLSSLIASIFTSLPRTIYMHLNSTIIGLLTHPSENVVKVAKQIVKYMCLEMPQVIAFDLFTAVLQNKDNEMFEDLEEVMQHEHPIFHAQLELVAQKLTKMAYTIYNLWIDKLTDCQQFLKNNDINSLHSTIKKLLHSLNQYSSCRYDETFKANFSDKEVLEEILQNDNPGEKENNILSKIIKSITSRQDSIRAIPLASLDETLDKKTSWNINMLGKFNKPDLKISKFFHSVERWKNGFKVSILGTDGKKYSYHLKRRPIYRNETSEQFMALIDSMTPFINVEHRSLIQVSPGVTLHEILKGHISIFDLIALYKQNSGQNPELEVMNVTSKLESIDMEKRIRKIKSLTEGEARYTLARAIFVTSRNANSWLQRTSMFASTHGALSVLSYIFGSVNTSPSDILFEKYSGATTFTAFRATGESQKVPFRLTPMFKTALGTCGVNGPFRHTFLKYLRAIRHNKNGIAPILQFVLGKAPFSEVCLPRSYIAKFGREVPLNTDIEAFHSRISGKDQELGKEVDELIESAMDVKKLAEMPPSWIPWW